ncbi:MAG: hypothetical protein IID63_05845 [candidate division Zixibacteria bacterium]|nr:hypothetical protein [candidate division Zixibacteria bacterium]
MRIFEFAPFRRIALPVLAVLNGLILAAPVKSGGTAVDYALCDVRVACFVQSTEEIDWPTLYYLNDNFGCRIDIILIKQRPKFQIETESLADKHLYLHRVYLSTNAPISVDDAVRGLFINQKPDLLLFESSFDELSIDRWIKSIKELNSSNMDLFVLSKAFKRVKYGSKEKREQIIVNAQEFSKRFESRMNVEIRKLLGRRFSLSSDYDRLNYYQRIKIDGANKTAGTGFLSGIDILRLPQVAEVALPVGPIRKTFVLRVNKFVSAFRAARNVKGKEHVAFVVEGYRALYDLTQHASYKQILSSASGLDLYLSEVMAKAEKAALAAVGLSWEGSVILRDTPRGPSLKYRISVVVDGPFEITLSKISFHPYWDTTEVILNKDDKTILPHQSFVREYYVEIDQKYLDSHQPDSLRFTAELAYSKIPLTISDVVPVWESPDLNIQFLPDFYFLPPVARLNIDRVVESLNWQVVISKPHDFEGTVKIDLKTPKGMFAGAYKQEIDLQSATTSNTIRIPFTISNLFELGIQIVRVSLIVDGQVVAADSGRIRVAQCHIADTVKIGFLPDSSGSLEDILRMTNATFQPITDRTLLVGNLNAYNVIAIGSQAYRNYSSFRKVRDRFEDYIRAGGSIVVFGQNQNWPIKSLPAAIVPTTELVTKETLKNQIPGARILSRPYKITETNLLSLFYKPVEVASAIVTPAERVYVTASGATLLSVSRLGQGQIIYCGLPLLEMIAKLNIDSIHLFANILNY